MGKYIVYIVCLLVVIFLLEWFRIVDIPYFDLPNYTDNKEVLYQKSSDTMED